MEDSVEIIVPSILGSCSASRRMDSTNNKFGSSSCWNYTISTVEERDAHGVLIVESDSGEVIAEDLGGCCFCVDLLGRGERDLGSCFFLLAICVCERMDLGFWIGPACRRVKVYRLTCTSIIMVIKT